MEDLPQDVHDFIHTLVCRRCGTPNGRGLSVKGFEEGDDVYGLAIRCLKCGNQGYLRVKSAIPKQIPAAAAEEISSEEVIDLHEALKSDNWLQELTGR